MDSEESFHAQWHAGQVVPLRITSALDFHGLHGPGVDRACHARHPDVDRWEAGTQYPQWHQLVGLAELTQFPLGFFFRAGQPFSVHDTSMRFHAKAKDLPPPIESVHSCDPDAIAAAVGQATLF